MRAFRPNTAFGELVVDGLSLHNYAFCMIDLRPLYLPQKYRGENVVMPQASGARAYPIRVDEAAHVLPMYFTDVCDMAGNQYDDRFVGYQTNIAILDGLCTPASDATKPATLETPNGDLLEADVQVLGFDQGSTSNLLESPFVWQSAITLRIPAGRFA